MSLKEEEIGTDTEGRPCKDTDRGLPSKRQGERPLEKTNPANSLISNFYLPGL